MEATVNSLMVGMACEDCKEALRKRLQKAVVEWTMLPASVGFRIRGQWTDTRLLANYLAV